MKIDGYRPDFDPSVQTDRTESAKRAEQAAGRTAADSHSDAVHLSSESQLAAKALDRANQPSPVRADHVERAKQLLASGELGKDANRLADAIIDRTIETNG